MILSYIFLFAPVEFKFIALSHEQIYVRKHNVFKLGLLLESPPLKDINVLINAYVIFY
jgi:hypothetical protein